MGTGMEKIKKLITIAKLLLLIAIAAGVPLYLCFGNHDIFTHFKSVDDVVLFLQQHEKESIPIYLGLQVLQIVICVIPGQAFQIAAGYMYPFFLALLLAMSGAVIGTAITFFLAKLLGRDFLHLFFGEDKMSYYIARLNSKKAYTLVFFLYLIPGIPKDVVSYASGASEMRFKPFIILSSIGRLPGMAGSLLVGNLLEGEHYVGFFVVVLLAVIAFILCVIFRHKINQWLDKIYEKLQK